jgi:anti-sigma factor RsiW
MRKRGDDRLVAYLDSALEMAERREIELWLESDPAARERLAALAENAQLLRLAFDEVMHEPVPERLIAAARGETVRPEAQIFAFKARARRPSKGAFWRWRVALPVAAGLCGLIVGGGAVYYDGAWHFAASQDRSGNVVASAAAASKTVWLDTAADYFKLFVRAGDNALVDVPATGDVSAALEKISRSLPQALRLPNLKPWGLNFRGARLVVVAGEPAAQLVYTTQNKAIGPLTLFIGSAKAPDILPTFDRRQNVNLLYWRHQGRIYILVGEADAGYLRGIANDVAWQLDAI